VIELHDVDLCDARVGVLETVIARIEAGMRRDRIDPPPDPGLASSDPD
jgi:hypothetical protein